jgi:hypothetical protein
MSHHRKSQWITYALLAGALVLAVAGVVLLASYFSGRRDRAVEIPTQTALAAAAVAGLHLTSRCSPSQARKMNASSARDAGGSDGVC